MKRRFGFVLTGLCLAALAGCETTSNNAPSITPALVQAGAQQHADNAALEKGRFLLLNRCTQCHAVPSTAQFNPDQIRQVVAIMSERAKLNAAEHDAVLKYVLTVHAAR